MWRGHAGAHACSHARFPESPRTALKQLEIRSLNRPHLLLVGLLSDSRSSRFLLFGVSPRDRRVCLGLTPTHSKISVGKNIKGQDKGNHLVPPPERKYARDKRCCSGLGIKLDHGVPNRCTGTKGRGHTTAGTQFFPSLDSDADGDIACSSVAKLLRHLVIAQLRQTPQARHHDHSVTPQFSCTETWTVETSRASVSRTTRRASL